MSPNPISLAIVAVLAVFGVLLIVLARLVVPGASLIVLAVIVLAALRMAQQWEQAVVLRAGKFLAVKGPGLFLDCSDPRQCHGTDRHPPAYDPVCRRADP